MSLEPRGARAPWDSLRTLIFPYCPDFDTFTEFTPPLWKQSPRFTTLHITGTNGAEGIPRTSLTVAVIEYAISDEGGAE